MNERLSRVADLLKLFIRHVNSGLLSAGADDEFLTNQPVTTDGAHAGGREGVGGDGNDEGPERLAADLEAMGPTYVKLGQLLSTRHDMLPPAYTEALTRLQDNVEPIEFDVVQSIFESEFGVSIGAVFASFDENPMAAASLGQVHRARTKTGKDVVVKIQRPDVRDIIAADMDVLSRGAGLIDEHTSMGERIRISDLLTQFRRSLADELDYRKELSNLQRLGELSDDHDDIVIPQPFADLSSSKVLTMDYIDGKNVTAVGPLGLLDIDGQRLASSLFSFFLETLLLEGLLHADPHPGNLLVTADHRLGLIDCGMVVRVPRRVRQQLVRLLIAIGEGDGEEAANILAGMGHPLQDYDAAAFRDEVSHMVSGVLALGNEFQAGSVIVKLARISGKHGLRPPAEMSMIGKALLNLDQAVQHLDPGFAPAEAIRDNLAILIESGLSVSPGNAMASALEAKEFAANLPRRANRIMDAVSNGELTMRVNAFDENRMLKAVHDAANRITVGLVLAAITVAAALMSGIDSGPQILGYPALSLIFFLVAAIGGLFFVAKIIVEDKHTTNRAKAAEAAPNPNNKV